MALITEHSLLCSRRILLVDLYVVLRFFYPDRMVL